MLEVQITDKKLYEKYKEFASYSCDYTGVLELREELLESLKSDGVKIDENLIERAEKPILTIQGRRIMKILHASPEMLYFLGVRTMNDTTIANQDMRQVYELISQGLVDVDEKFKNVYSYLGYRNKVNELICSTLYYRDSGRLTDYVEGTSTIQTMNLPDIASRDIEIHEKEIVITSQIIDYKRTWVITGKTNDGDMVRITFYNKTQLLRSIAFPGHKITIAFPKADFRKGTYYLTDPLILPKGFSIFPYKGYKSPKPRQIVSLHFLNAYWEFKVRNEYGNRK